MYKKNRLQIAYPAEKKSYSEDEIYGEWGIDGLKATTGLDLKRHEPLDL